MTFPALFDVAGEGPIEVLVTGTASEPFTFSVPLESGSSFPLDGYEVEYSLADQFTLTSGNGIRISDADVAFESEAVRLAPGTYPHGCYIRNVATGERAPFFDGSVTINGEPS